MQAIIKAYQEQQRLLGLSPYSYQDGKIVSSHPVANDSEKRDLVLANVALDTIRTYVRLTNGTKVIVTGQGDAFDVIFDANVKPGTLGADYAAKVKVGRKTHKVVSVLVGS